MPPYYSECLFGIGAVAGDKCGFCVHWTFLIIVLLFFSFAFCIKVGLMANLIFLRCLLIEVFE